MDAYSKHSQVKLISAYNKGWTMPTFLKRGGFASPPAFYASAIGYIPLIKASSAFLGENCFYWCVWLHADSLLPKDYQFQQNLDSLVPWPVALPPRSPSNLEDVETSMEASYKPTDRHSWRHTTSSSITEKYRTLEVCKWLLTKCRWLFNKECY